MQPIDRPTKHRLFSKLVLSISNGEPVDWNECENGAVAERDRELIAALKVIAAAAMPVANDVQPSPDIAGNAIPTQHLQRWGHLEIRAKVAEGMFGEVYRAWDTTLGREVALKLLRDDGAEAQNAGAIGSFILKEGRHLARVRHTNVITVHGAGTHDGRVGLWMEYIVGRTLEDLLAQQGRFGARQAALIGIDLCRALIAVHGAGLVHRDVKARNVMIEDGGRTVLMDFGAGQEMRPESASKASTIAGTPYYMAPEVLNGDQPSRRSDIYSLGVLLYRLVTREYPVEGTSVLELRAVHEQRGSRLLRDARPDLSEAFVQVVEKALDREPRHRFASAGEMEQALVATLDLRPTHRTSPVRRPSRRAVVLSCVGIVVAIALGSLLLRGGAARAPAAASVTLTPATWRTDGVPACAAPGKQSVTTLVADGHGGAIVAWQDDRNGNNDIYAQRYDALGAPQWATDGIPVCNAEGDQFFVDTWFVGSNPGPPVTSCVSDGEGGVLIAWVDKRAYDIYAQRITAAGVPARGWPANGVALVHLPPEQNAPAIASDGNGGAIVAWEDRRDLGFSIYAQRIDAAGRPVWAADGIAVRQAPISDERDPSIVTDGTGGAVICWRESPGDELRAQRVDAAGLTLWGDGVSVCAAPGERQRAMVVSDGAGGAIFTWEDRRSGTFDIYAQRITDSGHIAPGWSPDGSGICIYWPHDQRDPVLVADGEGGAIIFWFDWRTFCFPQRTCGEIYAQRVSASGDVHWRENGVVICSILGDAATPSATSDGVGGAIVAWTDYRSASPPYSTTPGSADIYAQRVDGSGAPQWTTSGVAISTAAGSQWLPFVDSDGAGGAAMTWPDSRNGNDDIYVNRITAAGVSAAATPIVVVPADMRISARPGSCSAKVDFDITAGGLPDPTVVCSPPSGRDFPAGSTTVQCKATNSSGTETRTFVVTVIESQTPTIQAPPAVTADREPGVPGRLRAGVALGEPNASDACEGMVVTNDAPEIFPVGTTLVTWTATDASGNMAVATQSVTVRDVPNP